MHRENGLEIEGNWTGQRVKFHKKILKTGPQYVENEQKRNYILSIWTKHGHTDTSTPIII